MQAHADRIRALLEAHWPTEAPDPHHQMMPDALSWPRLYPGIPLPPGAPNRGPESRRRGTLGFGAYRGMPGRIVISWRASGLISFVG